MSDTETISEVQRARREFMEKAGKIAVYTPPVMMGLLLPGEHAIASGQYQAPSGTTEKIKIKKIKKPKKEKNQ